MQVRFGEAFKVTYKTPMMADEKFAKRQVLDTLAVFGIKAKFIKTDTQGDLLVFNGRKDTLTRYEASESALRQAMWIKDQQEKNASLDEVLAKRAELFSQPDGEVTVASEYSFISGGTYLSDDSEIEIVQKSLKATRGNG